MDVRSHDTDLFRKGKVAHQENALTGPRLSQRGHAAVMFKGKRHDRRRVQAQTHKAFRHLPLEELWKFNQKEMGSCQGTNVAASQKASRWWDSKPTQLLMIGARDTGVLHPEVAYSHQEVDGSWVSMYSEVDGVS